MYTSIGKAFSTERESVRRQQGYLLQYIYSYSSQLIKYEMDQWLTLSSILHLTLHRKSFSSETYTSNVSRCVRTPFLKGNLKVTNHNVT